MDKLSDLPPKNDSVKTADEETVMGQFFPKGHDRNPSQSEDVQDQGQRQSLIQKVNWKLIGCSAVLFILLANPWIDKIFCKVPYCGDNAIALLGLKVLLFILVLIVMSLFS